MVQRSIWIVGIIWMLSVITLAFAEENKRDISKAVSQIDAEVQTDQSQFNLEGKLHFTGTPMSTLTSVRPFFWFRDETTGMEYLDATTTYDTTNSEYTISNLPSGFFAISITFHTTGSEATLPGNYRAWHVLDPSTLSESERMNHDIGMQKTMRLTSPWDNSQIATIMGEPYPAYPSPVIFSWESIPQATSYTIIIWTYTDPDHPSGYSFVETTVQTEVTSTTYSATLEDNDSDEHYEFSLTAWLDYEAIGIYMTTYMAGFGWDYRFKVDSSVGVGGYDPHSTTRPNSFTLSQNYPNPFNPKTDIRYQIPDYKSSLHTVLKIYNILGQEVRTLIDEEKEPGYYTVTWNGRDSNGTQVPCGVYFYRLTAGDFTATRRMVLIK